MKQKFMIKLAKFLGSVIMVFSISMMILTAFLVGYIKGYDFGRFSIQEEFQKLISDKVSSIEAPVSTPIAKTTPSQTVVPKPAWGGPQLWEAVNKRRIELGVNPLQAKDEVCTIASIRLNQLLELGKLDGHVGFSNMPEARPDLKWIFEKYSLSEFLVSGAASPQEAVSLWENTLGHKQLLTGGEYVWGCIYAQNGFGVAIAAY